MNIKDCKACKLRGGCFSPLPPRLSFPGIPVNMMFVLDRPSKEEDNLESGFDDRHNRYLESIIEEEGRGIYYLTYATKCFNELTFSQQKKQGQICYNTWLKGEVEAYKTRAVICLGQLAHHFLIRKRWNNKTYNKDIGNMYIDEGSRLFGTYYSPFYLFSRGKEATSKFREFLGNVRNAMETLKNV